MTMSEQEMEQAIEEAKRYFEYPPQNNEQIILRKLIEIIEYQKGVGLAAWAENWELRKKIAELKI
jgi:peptide deformylase